VRRLLKAAYPLGSLTRDDLTRVATALASP
jgi:hypothetical protein